MGGDFEKIYYFLKEDFYRKGIKEWVEDLAANEKLAKKFEGIEDPKEILELAKKEGYEFTEEKLMDLKMEAVSGGFDINKAYGTVRGFINKANNYLGPKVRDALRPENVDKVVGILRGFKGNGDLGGK